MIRPEFISTYYLAHHQVLIQLEENWVFLKHPVVDKSDRKPQ